MFITRKVYGAGQAGYVGYVVSDKYGHETQLTPIEAQELHQWLSDNAWQIHNDVNGIADEEPPDLVAEMHERIEAPGETEEEEFARISLDDAPDEDDPAINP